MGTTTYTGSAASYEEVCRVNPAVARTLWLDFTALWLSACSRVFKGDLEMMLVLLVLARAELGDNAQCEKGRMGAMMSVSASRIAEITGVPRETVRRKLDVMAGRRWVEQGANHAWRLSRECRPSQVARDLAELDDISIRHIAEFVSRFMTVLGSAAGRLPLS